MSCSTCALRQSTSTWENWALGYNHSAELVLRIISTDITLQGGHVLVVPKFEGDPNMHLRRQRRKRIRSAPWLYVQNCEKRDDGRNTDALYGFVVVMYGGGGNITLLKLTQWSASATDLSNCSSWSSLQLQGSPWHLSPTPRSANTANHWLHFCIMTGGNPGYFTCFLHVMMDLSCAGWQQRRALLQEIEDAELMKVYDDNLY
jgi:hypothetical protein